jgi:ribosomal protein S18 acetylase RimI-like enzyme
MTQIVCREATASEAPACLALLPEAWGLPVHLLIARRDGRFAGAAALYWQSWADPPGFPVWLRVGPPFRRQGVGRALVEEAAALAAAEVGGLWSLRPVTANDEAIAFLEAQGFAPQGRSFVFRARIADLRASIAPILARARGRGGAIDEFRFEPVSEATLSDAAWLLAHGRLFDPIGAHRALRRRVDGGPEAALDRSHVALDGDTVAGVILWRIEDRRAFIDAQVVGEAWRGGPLYLLMLETQMVRGLGEGLTEIAFASDERATSTMGLARRSGAIRIETKVRLYRGPGPPPC